MGGHLIVMRVKRRARDLFRKTYWVECVHCRMSTGPHTAADAAMVAAAECPHEYADADEFLCLIHGPILPSYDIDRLVPYCGECGGPVTPIYGTALDEIGESS